MISKVPSLVRIGAVVGNTKKSSQYFNHCTWRCFDMTLSHGRHPELFSSAPYTIDNKSFGGLTQQS